MRLGGRIEGEVGGKVVHGNPKKRSQVSSIVSQQSPIGDRRASRPSSLHAGASIALPLVHARSGGEARFRWSIIERSDRVHTMSPREVLEMVKGVVHSITSCLFKGAPPLMPISPSGLLIVAPHRLPPPAPNTLKLSTFQVRQKIFRHLLSPSITISPDA